MKFGLLVETLRLQVPRLHKAIQEKHGLRRREVLSWFIFLYLIQSTASAASLLQSFLVGGLGFQPGLAINTFFTVFAGCLIGLTVFGWGVGSWVRSRASGGVTWDEWLEFYFFTQIPSLFGALLVSVFPSLTVIALPALLYSLYLLYSGLKVRFRFLQEKKGKLEIFLASVFAVLLAIGTVGALLKPSGLNVGLLSGESDWWEGELPQQTQKEIHAVFPNDPKKSKAAIQYANAIWQDINPQSDPEKTIEELMKTVSCLSVVGIGEDDRRRVKGLVLNTKEKVRAFLERDKQWSGRMLPNPGDRSDVCD